MHNSSFGGHSGIHGTYMRLKHSFFWSRMKREVIQLVRECDSCQKIIQTMGTYLIYFSLVLFLIQLGLTSHWISLPKSAAKNVILVVVDRLTKYGHLLALSNPYTAESMAKLFLDTIYKLHGVPLSIVSDRYRVFTSTFWNQIGVFICLSSSTNG